jgi:hypothetical protein
MKGRDGICLLEFLELHENDGEPIIVKDLRKKLDSVRKL